MMICQVKKIWITRATRVLLLLSGLAVLLQTPVLAIVPTPPPPTQSVIFGWDPSTDTNVVGYNIYYGTASQIYTNKVSVGNVTTATISGLIQGTTYYFAATTYDASNDESAFSAEISYTVPVPTTNQPPAITAMQATNTAIVGQNVTFSIKATGTGPLAYQWMYNANPIASATNAVLTLNNVTTAQDGTYYANVSNNAGSTNSATASLTVYSTTAATLSPASYLNSQFALSVAGVPNYQYVVQASTNLINWVPVQTNTAPFTFVDANASQFSQRFYRTYLATYLPTSAVSDITSGLVAWYPLAGDVNDHSGNGNNGTAVGSPSFGNGVNGAANTAIVLNGAGQYVSSAPVSSSNFTFSAWMQYTGSLPASGFRVGATYGTGGFYLGLFSDGKTALVSDSNVNNDLKGSILTSSAWHHWCGVVNNSTLYAYYDGVFYGSSSVAVTDRADNNFIIGNYASGASFWQGSIAGVRIYNRALSSAEVGTLYTNGISGGVF